jgi:hypothetical protein
MDSFVLSEVAHMLMMLFHDPIVHCRETFVFFLLQPGAIFFEVLREGLMRRIRSLRLRQNIKVDLDFGVISLYSPTFWSGLPNTGYGNFEN